jgi:signal transduction histidine kinase
MIPERLIEYFLPDHLHNKLHPDYEQFRNVVIGAIVVAVMLLSLSGVVIFFTPFTIEYYLVGCSIVLCLVTLYSIKLKGTYYWPVIVIMALSYFNNIHGSVRTGGIYSPNVSILYLPLLISFWGLGIRAGLWMAVGNVAALVFIYNYIDIFHEGEPQGMPFREKGMYALMLHISITVFTTAFLYMVLRMYNKARRMIKKQQLIKIKMLDKEIAERTLQLSTMRQNLARDFHDETGNMLSAITRQAGVLRMRLGENEAVMPLVDNILLNSKMLYDSSKDFIWSINHNSDDPKEVFSYLTSFGQFFYNQFDIAFSVKGVDQLDRPLPQLPSFSGRQIIYIFKEAMTNAAKHSSAEEVELEMKPYAEFMRFVLRDNGSWKKPDHEFAHHGLSNMEKRCTTNNFKLAVTEDVKGTRIQVDVPVAYLPSEERLKNWKAKNEQKIQNRNC